MAGPETGMGQMHEPGIGMTRLDGNLDRSAGDTDQAAMGVSGVDEFLANVRAAPASNLQQGLLKIGWHQRKPALFQQIAASGGNLLRHAIQQFAPTDHITPNICTAVASSEGLPRIGQAFRAECDSPLFGNC